MCLDTNKLKIHPIGKKMSYAPTKYKYVLKCGPYSPDKLYIKGNCAKLLVLRFGFA